MVIQRRVAKYVPGNHCNKLYRYFLGNNVKLQHGIETTVREYVNLHPKEQSDIRSKFMVLYETADLYLQLPEVKEVIAHAGIKQSYIGKMNQKVKTFVLYGDITCELHQDGRLVRKASALRYYADDFSVYVQSPVNQPLIVNKTINIDTRCVFGNAITAFYLPKETIVIIPSKQLYVADRFHSF